MAIVVFVPIPVELRAVNCHDFAGKGVLLNVLGGVLYKVLFAILEL